MSAEIGEFEVDSVEQQADGIFLIGRCVGGVVQVGSVFRKVYYPEPVNDREPWGQTKKSKWRFVMLSVEDIEAYRTKLKEIQAGLTARLKVTGQGWESLEQYDVLVCEQTGQTP